MREKVTIQVLADWIIELLKKTSKKKEIESNLLNSLSKKKEKKIIIKTKKAEIVDLITSSDSSQSITKNVVDVKEKDDLKNDANDENIESATTKKKSVLSAIFKLSISIKFVTESSTQSFIALTWTSINQFTQIIVLSSLDQDRTLNSIKTSILVIFKLLNSHSCQYQKCDSTTHEKYVARCYDHLDWVSEWSCKKHVLLRWKVYD